MMTTISGKMPPSSHASSELSTASLTVVSNALRALSKPRRWRFLTKNSLTDTSFWRAAISSAVAPRRLVVGVVLGFVLALALRSFTALSIGALSVGGYWCDHARLNSPLVHERCERLTQAMTRREALRSFSCIRAKQRVALQSPPFKPADKH